jgi:hypothetical protein
MNAQPVNPQPGANLWNIIAATGTEIDQISINQNMCCAETFTTLYEIESKIDGITTTSCDLSAVFIDLDEINLEALTIASRIDALSIITGNNFAGTFTALESIEDCDLSLTYSLINTAIVVEFTTQSKLDLCCTTLNSKIDTLSFTDDLCASVTLSQSDVIAGTLTLSTMGQHYCLSQNIIGNISITAANVTLDLNDHTVNGLVMITAGASRAIIQNGKVIPTASPATNADAANGAVRIQATQVQLLNLIIQCPTSTTVSGNDGVNGLTGISIENANTLIKQCRIVAGMGGNGQIAEILGGAGGMGGIGINTIVGASNTSIIQSSITSGVGGTGANSNTVLVGLANVGGASGNGINANDNNMLIVECFITTGMGGQGGSGTSINFASAAGGNSGIAINSTNTLLNNLQILRSEITTGVGGGSGFSNFNSGNAPAGSSGIAINNSIANATIDSCFISTGTGGQGGTFSSGTNGAGGDGGSSGIVINNSANIVAISNCVLTSGLGGSGGLGNFASNPSPQGSGGASGNCIVNSGSNVVIENNIITSGAGATGVSSNINSGGGNGGASGSGIANSGTSITIKNNTITTANAGDGGNGANSLGAGDGGNAGFGITNSGSIVYIQNNIITAQNGGNAGIGNSGFGAARGGTGGFAIATSGNNVACLNNTFKAGNGGNGGDTNMGSVGGTAGNGGIGLYFDNGDNGQSRNNSVIMTGNGGHGGGGFIQQGDAGSGGDGIFINSPCTHTEVGLNTIANTGTIGTGIGTPVAGYAVNDIAATASPNASVIYSNFAYNIANTTPFAYFISGNSTTTSGAIASISALTNNRLNNIQSP